MTPKKYVVVTVVMYLVGSAPSARQRASEPHEFFSVDHTTISWSELSMPNKQSLYRKTLLANKENGTGVDLLRYPAGVVTPVHTHPHGHGMYVLQGTLVTNHGTFASGMFVWFPEGEKIYHGATKDADTVVLFLRHEPFQIDFVDSADGERRK